MYHDPGEYVRQINSNEKYYQAYRRIFQTEMMQIKNIINNSKDNNLLRNVLTDMVFPFPPVVEKDY